MDWIFTFFVCLAFIYVGLKILAMEERIERLEELVDELSTSLGKDSSAFYDGTE